MPKDKDGDPTVADKYTIFNLIKIDDKHPIDYFARKIIKTGIGTPLNSSISRLYPLLTESDLGLVYTALALSQPKANRVADMDTIDGKNQAKLRFQESTRVGLYVLNIQVNGILESLPDANPFEDLKDTYTSRLQQIVEERRRFNSGIEGEVYRITQGRENFEAVGEAVREGAESYLKLLEERRSWQEIKAAEYNKINDALRKK